MSSQSNFSRFNSDPAETTGRYVVTFQDDALEEGIRLLQDQAGINALPRANDFAESALDMSQMESAGGAIFSTLGVAVVSMEEDALSAMMTILGNNSPILAIEPERIHYAINEGLTPDYLRGYRDAAGYLYQQAKTSTVSPETSDSLEEVISVTATFADNTVSTWGLQATNAISSRYTGRGINIAVLDTGFDFSHPDFQGRSVVSRSFVSDGTVQDTDRHGTHCIGTACGHQDSNGRRYGVAYQSNIYVGKVLDNRRSGNDGDVMAGMEWAIRQGCAVISMSLGNKVATSSAAYEDVGRRALNNGCLVIAAAGNHRLEGAPPIKTVGQPANSPSIMAVGAIDNRLNLYSGSCRSGTGSGGNVDIVGPGVSVYSSLLNGRNGNDTGTSMATPHVAGIAALYAEATGQRGWDLWRLLISNTLPLSALLSVDVGSGLVQSPR
ncbi:MAG: S8 family serine peptidase [Snowella sp.]|nr:S8 family serine peptidase [Snowella sp.]